MGRLGAPAPHLFAPRVNAWTTVVAFASCFLVAAVHSEEKAHFIPCLSAFSNFSPLRLFPSFFAFSCFFATLLCVPGRFAPGGTFVLLTWTSLDDRMIICGAPCPAFSLCASIPLPSSVFRGKSRRSKSPFRRDREPCSVFHLPSNPHGFKGPADRLWMPSGMTSKPGQLTEGL